MLRQLGLIAFSLANAGWINGPGRSCFSQSSSVANASKAFNSVAVKSSLVIIVSENDATLTPKVSPLHQSISISRC